MKRIGAMAAVALIALLLALPVGAAMAQDGGNTAGNLPPATLFGMVTADGLPVPEGTMITAMVGDEKIGSTMTMQGGSFGPLELMQPSGDDMMVTFMVGDRMSPYTYAWISGGLENEMITANLADDAGAMGPAGMDGAAGAAGLKGDPGAPGEQGAPGAQGPAGEPGTAGADGAAGGQGPQGPTWGHT